MCLPHKFHHSIPVIQGWKIFAIRDGKLISAFFGSNPNHLVYTPNSWISCELDNYFYVFAQFQDAVNVCLNDNGFWVFKASSSRIVLPVTLADVAYEGYLIERSRDPQSLDAHYQSYMGKRVYVHDNPNNRKQYQSAAARKMHSLGTTNKCGIG